MCAGNMWTRTRQSILVKYDERGVLQQQQAWFLFLYCIITGVLNLFFALFMLYAGEKGGTTILIGAIITWSGAILVWLRKYLLAANVLVMVNIVLLTYGAYDTYTSPIIFDGFTTYFLYCPAFIAFTALFRDRKTVLLVFAWFAVVIIAYFVALQGQLTPAHQEMVKKMFIFGLSSLVLTVILSVLLVTAMQRSNQNLVDSVSDVREASEKITDVSNIIGDSSKVMSEGASTQAAAMEETASSLKGIYEKTKINEATVLEARQLMNNVKGVITETHESLRKLKMFLDQVNYDYVP